MQKTPGDEGVSETSLQATGPSSDPEEHFDVDETLRDGTETKERKRRGKGKTRVRTTGPSVLSRHRPIESNPKQKIPGSQFRITL